MSKIGTNKTGRPTKKKRAQITFNTGIHILDEFYKMIWQHGLQKIADETNVSESTLRSWMRGDSVPSIKKAQQILDLLGFELLIFEKDESFN